MTPAEMYEMARILKDQAHKLENEARAKIISTLNINEDSGYNLNNAEITMVELGSWIDAVKNYRTRMQVDLRTAKTAVDQYRERYAI